MIGNPPDNATMEAARVARAERMRALRSEAKMSQRTAAHRAGMDPRNWSRIERAELHPRLDSLLRIQFALGLQSIEALFGSQATGELIRSVRDTTGGPTRPCRALRRSRGTVTES